MRTHALRFAILLFALAFASGSANAVGIYDIQYTTSTGGTSPLVGQVVTTTGVVTARTPDGYVIADDVGPWHGVFVYTYGSCPGVGDEVQVTGTVAEYYGQTEVGNLTDYQLLSTGNPVLPDVVGPSEADQESYESVLVRVENLEVTDLLSYGEWEVDSTLVCDDLFDYVYFPRLGDHLESITGVVAYLFGAFKLEPRNTSDISGAPIPHYALAGDVVTMNEAREVLPDHYVEIQGDRIVAILPTAPSGLTVVDTDGLIFPGLIDAHNHPYYNTLDVIPFGSFFQDRDEWRSSSLYGEFSDQYHSICDYGGTDAQLLSILKLSELRALCAGTTTMQGANCDGDSYAPFAHQGMGINNAERFPSRILSKTFPLSEGSSYWAARAGECWDRFVVHLSEGVSQAAQDEFTTWKTWGLLDERTTLIHGVALGEHALADLAAAGGHLVWSPRSNMVLYDATADIPSALAAGVNVALAPDWTESGSPDVLTEMKYAQLLGDSLWGGILTPLQLTEMVTRNAADALGAAGEIGRIAPGYRADLMVVRGGWDAPYDALLSADAEDVSLTVVSGRPMYGAPTFMSQFPFLSDTEDITVGSVTRRLATRIQSHAYAGALMSAADVLSGLETAYEAGGPPICCFMPIRPAACSRAPVGHAESYQAVWGNTLTVPAPGVLANDFDGDGDPLQAVLAAGPGHAASFSLASNGGFTYRHDALGTEADTFTYMATDGSLFSDTVTVTLTITQPTGVMDAEISPRSGRLDVNPNPSCAATALLFALPEPGEARLVIYDAAGRLVRELQSGESAAGEFAASWDGRDDRGERMAPGVYFARLEAPGFTATRKIALLR